MSCEFIDEPWQSEAPDGVVGPTGSVCEGGGEITFADPGGSGDEDIQVFAEPTEIGDLCEL